MSATSADAARGQLAGWPIIVDAAVAWGEMDAFAHVNNVTYFRYFESARIAYFDAIGYTELMRTQAHGPILAETRCRFRAALTYPDRIAIATRVRALGADRFEMDYAVASERLGRVAAEGDGLIVAYDYEAGERMQIPAAIRARIIALQPDLAGTAVS